MVTMSGENSIKWSVVVSKDTDRDLRAFLGNRGSMRKGDLSKFIEDAVRWRMFDQSIAKAREGFADLPPDQAQALVDEACEAVGVQMWPKPGSSS